MNSKHQLEAVENTNRTYLRILGTIAYCIVLIFLVSLVWFAPTGDKVFAFAAISGIFAFVGAIALSY